MAHVPNSAEQYEKMIGTPIPQLVSSLAIPTTISMLVTVIYNTADTYFVSQINKSASAAVGMVYTLMAILQAVGYGLGMGAGSLISRKLGEKDDDAAERYAVSAFVAAILAGAVVGWGCLAGLKPILHALKCTDTMLPYAVPYARRILLAAPVSCASFVLNNTLRAEGESTLAMWGLGLGGVLNIVLDPLFIFTLDMGAGGAALATVISQGLSCVWVICFLRGKKTLLRLKRENLLVSPKLILPCVALGLAAFIMQSSESMISVCFNSSLLRYGGDVAVGAMTILSSVMQFAMLPLQGIAQGAQPISSYNYGARNADRVRQTFRLLLRVCLVYSMVLWAGIMLFPRGFAGIFTPDAELLDFTARALRIYCAMLFLFGIQIACQMTFVSIGNAPCSIIVAILRKFVLLIPLIFILPHILPDQTMAVYTAEPAADTLAVIFTMVMFGTQFKKALKKLNEA